ncbi:MAG: hypothetical protein RL163_2451 [Pseudomonadota bacterium]|jgi:tripartite-type tricarboxylate transporter receptor subunit TctC
MQQVGFSRRKILSVIGAGALTSPLHAQPAYPSKAIRLVVPFSAGSASDILARSISDKLQISLARPVLVENRPGAGGTIATGMVAKAEPDGHTLVVVSAGHVVNPSIYKTLGYDTLRDLSGVIPLASLPSVLVVPGASAWKSVADLTAAARSSPGKLNFVSGGVGSASHVNAEKFCYAARVRVTHVPLKGAPEMAVEIASGRADFGFMPVIAALPALKDGRLKALAVSHDKRSSVLPDVPTIAEAGEPGGFFNFWIGLLAPSKTPRPIVQRLHMEIASIIKSPELAERYARLGADVMDLSPDRFDALMAEELQTLGAIMRAANVKAE